MKEFKIPVLFENDDFIIINKPEGIAAIPERDLTLPSVKDVLEKERNETLRIVHRIDKEVSGLMIYARKQKAHEFLCHQFHWRLVYKTYAALVHKVCEQDTCTIDAAIRQFGSGRVGIDPENGKASITDVEVIERYRYFSLVHAHPHTGRRHQIRVHLYHIGHPIIGDSKYGNLTLQRNFPRVMLHALGIKFTGPDNQQYEFSCPPPQSFIDLQNDVKFGLYDQFNLW